MDNESGLIKEYISLVDTQKSYIKLLTEEYERINPFCHAHGINASTEAIVNGETIRNEIKNIEQTIHEMNIHTKDCTEDNPKMREIHFDRELRIIFDTGDDSYSPIEAINAFISGVLKNPIYFYIMTPWQSITRAKFLCAGCDNPLYISVLFDHTYPIEQFKTDISDWMKKYISGNCIFDECEIGETYSKYKQKKLEKLLDKGDPTMVN